MNNVPVTHSNESTHRRFIAEAVNQLIPVVKSVTFTLSSTTTTVIDEKMGEDKTVVLIPTSADAASENWHLSTKSNGSFVIAHTNAVTSRTFDYLITG